MPTKDNIMSIQKGPHRIEQQDRQFLNLVHEGLTREGLDRCIQNDPGSWSRFASFRDLLPTSTADAQCQSDCDQLSINRHLEPRHEFKH